MAALFWILWLLCGVICYFIMKSKGYPNSSCLAHGLGGLLLGIIWVIVTALKKDYQESVPSQLNDMELLSKLAEMKDKGIITQEEFETKKTEIMGKTRHVK